MHKLDSAFVICIATLLFGTMPIGGCSDPSSCNDAIDGKCSALENEVDESEQACLSGNMENCNSSPTSEVPESTEDVDFCSREPSEICGNRTCGADGVCGVDCGSCLSGTCSAEGYCVSTCEATTCQQQGISCGTTVDGCGQTLNCGACPADKFCSESGQCETIDCSAECSALQYTECTCSSNDPCNWTGDGVCDDPCASLFPADHFVDANDCSAANGSWLDGVTGVAAEASDPRLAEFYSPDRETLALECPGTTATREQLLSYFPRGSAILQAQVGFGYYQKECTDLTGCSEYHEPYAGAVRDVRFIVDEDGNLFFAYRPGSSNEQFVQFVQPDFVIGGFTWHNLDWPFAESPAVRIRATVTDEGNLCVQWQTLLQQGQDGTQQIFGYVVGDDHLAPPGTGSLPSDEPVPFAHYTCPEPAVSNTQIIESWFSPGSAQINFEAYVRAQIFERTCHPHTGCSGWAGRIGSWSLDALSISGSKLFVDFDYDPTNIEIVGGHFQAPSMNGHVSANCAGVTRTKSEPASQWRTFEQRVFESADSERVYD